MTHTFCETFASGEVRFPRVRRIAGEGSLQYHMGTSNSLHSLDAIDAGLLVGTREEMELQAQRLRNMRNSRGMSSHIDVVSIL